MSAFALLLFLETFALFLVLGFVVYDPSLFFQSPQAQRVRHQRGVFGLFLLFDGEHRILTNLRCSVADRVGVLHSDEILVGSTNLGRNIVLE